MTRAYRRAPSAAGEGARAVVGRDPGYEVRSDTILDTPSAGSIAPWLYRAFNDGDLGVVVPPPVRELKFPSPQGLQGVGHRVHRRVEVLCKVASRPIGFVIGGKSWFDHPRVLRRARHAVYALVRATPVALLTTPRITGSRASKEVAESGAGDEVR